MHQTVQSQAPDSPQQTRLSARPKWPRLSRSDWLLIIIGAIAGISTATFLVTNGFRRASELTQAQRWEAHTLNVIATAERTRSAIRNMQRGERGYLLTSNETYLKPYYEGRQQARSRLQELTHLVHDNREQVATLADLSAVVGKIDERLAAQISDQRAGRSAAALASVRTGLGERLIGAADANIDDMIQVENGLLQQRRRALSDANAAAAENRLALSVLGLAALCAVVWLLFRTMTARRAVDFERDRADLAEQLVRRDAQLAEQIEELNALYASAPIGLAFFSRDYRYLRINAELARIHGLPIEEHLSRPLREIVPINAGAIEPLIDQVFQTGEPIRNFEVGGETPLLPGVTRHWLTGFYPVKNEAGDVDAVGAWVIEISDRKRAEEREALLAREVDHRAKNLLAVVQSVVQLTHASNPEELKAGVIGRIQALARAHSLLADSRWDGALLGELVREELAPYLDGTDTRVKLDGPALLLRPAAAQSLAMVLHELATNAVKYGALSTPQGHLEVRWSRDANNIDLNWTEDGGPPTTAPTTSGFGSKIMRASIERQLHGRLEQAWRPGGLQCTIRISPREALGAAEYQ